VLLQGIFVTLENSYVTRKLLLVELILQLWGVSTMKVKTNVAGKWLKV
jgi:hypothetical protein